MVFLTGGLVISQLVEWLRWHFTDGERLFSDIKREEFPEDHSEYWDCVSSFCIGYLYILDTSIVQSVLG